MNPDDLERRQKMAGACEQLRRSAFPHLSKPATEQQRREVQMQEKMAALRKSLFKQ